MALPSFSPHQTDQKSSTPIPSDQSSETGSLLLHQHIQQLRSILHQSTLSQYQTLILSAESLLSQKEAQSKQLRLQNLALQQKLASLTLQNRQLCSIARRSDAVAAALRVSLQSVVMQNEAAAREREGFGDSEESCCEGAMGASRFKRCRVCGEREASILLIPCNHLCVCGECEELVGECPSCRRTKTGAMKMNVERLQKMAGAVRTGGKGSMRRKKKVVHKMTTTDDKRLQTTLKRIGVNAIPAIEEVNIFTDDAVIQFQNPKVQASISANTWVIGGAPQTKKLQDLLPSILSQLGTDNLESIKMLAEQFQKHPPGSTSGAGGAILEEDDDEDVPDLVGETFETASETQTRAA